MKKIAFLGILLISFINIFGQNEIDALRFSQVFWEGTSRTMAMGSSFSALGPDVYSMAINPAGIGFYKKGEIEMSLGLSTNSTTSYFSNSSYRDLKNSFKFNSFGIILNWKTDLEDKNGFIFGFGYNKTNNFSKRIVINGVNNYGSMIDYFTYQALGYTPNDLDPFGSFLAYDTYLIDTFKTLTDYTNPLWYVSNNNPKYGETQSYLADISGNMAEWNFALAYDFEDFVSIGGSLNFVSGSYNLLSYYSESDFKDSTDLLSFNYDIYNKVDISGVNFKLGVLVVPTKFLRFGLAFHSPSFLTLNDVYKTSMETHWATPDSLGYTDYSSASPDNYYTYHISTPMRAIAAVGFVLGKFMAFNAEYEYADYSNIVMSAKDYAFFDENNAIRNNYKATNNFRIGTEFKYSVFYTRLGFAFYDSPYKSSVNHLPEERKYFTGGLGLKTDKYFFDLAVKIGLYSETYYIYNGYTDEPIPTLDNKLTFISFGGGIRF